MAGTTSTLAQTMVKNPTPNTQRMVSATLAKHRAKQEHKRPMVTISNETLANGDSTVYSQDGGRDKDEDDEQWWRRCIARSAAMKRPGGKMRQRWR